MNVAGLIIAAGHATRLGHRDGSKELIPVTNLPALSGLSTADTCPVVRYLLNTYRQAGISRVATVYREDKQDIPPGVQSVCHSLGLSNQAIATTPTRGPVETICKALPVLADHTMAFGFPDIIANPPDIIAHLLQGLARSDVDVMMALLPTTRPDKVDLVATDEQGIVTDIVIKDAHCTLPWTWAHLVWTPAFSRFLLQWNASAADTAPDKHRRARTGTDSGAGDQHVAHALLDAMRTGLRIGTRRFEAGTMLDIGTPEDLALAQSSACRALFA